MILLRILTIRDSIYSRSAAMESKLLRELPGLCSSSDIEAAFLRTLPIAPCVAASPGLLFRRSGVNVSSGFWQRGQEGNHQRKTWTWCATTCTWYSVKSTRLCFLMLNRDMKPPLPLTPPEGLCCCGSGGGCCTFWGLRSMLGRGIFYKIFTLRKI